MESTLTLLIADERVNMGLRGTPTLSSLVADEEKLNGGLLIAEGKPKHKHRMNGTQNYNAEKRFLSEMQSAVGEHVRRLTTHDAFIESIKARIWEQPLYKRLTHASVARISGYLQASGDMIYHHHLTWTMFCDGKLYTRKGIDAIDKAVPGAWSRIDSDRSCHVWTASIGDDKINLDQEKLKPYNIKAPHLLAKEKV